MKGRRRGQGGHGKGRLRIKCEVWLENGRCTLLIKMECWCKSDCCWDEVNLVTLSCWGYYQIVHIGLSLLIYLIDKLQKIQKSAALLVSS